MKYLWTLTLELTIREAQHAVKGSIEMCLLFPHNAGMGVHRAMDSYYRLAEGVKQVKWMHCHGNRWVRTNPAMGRRDSVPDDGKQFGFGTGSCEELI